MTQDRIECGHLWRRHCTVGIRNRRCRFWPAVRLSASQEGLVWWGEVWYDSDLALFGMALTLSCFPHVTFGFSNPAISFKFKCYRVDVQVGTFVTFPHFFTSFVWVGLVIMASSCSPYKCRFGLAHFINTHSDRILLRAHRSMIPEVLQYPTGPFET